MWRGSSVFLGCSIGGFLQWKTYHHKYGMANRAVVINGVKNLILNKVHTLYQALIHTSFHCFAEIGHISVMHNNIFFHNKNTSQVEIWPVSCLNDSEKTSKQFPGQADLRTPLEACAFSSLRHLFRKSVSIYSRLLSISSREI